ncbi:unnamed protein product [Bursaphelenchus xylophilus]|uniref:(pine wood nematode) hypothetical protein n=1 Tax=Bursaphelenchus xylophilus TaxID=6326 RepID=A0A1I7RTJ8_BURXY|nr:unnamed protein product [Bursaphelenchus xylophilus]CAG9122389.1 unnamed protein product [Bursaphelenchus xylophilus]
MEANYTPTFIWPHKFLVDFFIVFSYSIVTFNLVTLFFTIFVVLRASNSVTKKYSYFLVNHLVWCVVSDVASIARDNVSLGSNGCYVFLGFVSNFDHLAALILLFLSYGVSLARTASEVGLFMIRFIASIHPESRFYVDIHNVATWKILLLFHVMIVVNVLLFMVRIADTDVILETRLRNLTQSDPAPAQISNEHIVLCFPEHTVSSHLIYSGVGFMAITGITLLVMFYNIKASKSSASTLRTHWMLFYALVAQAVAHTVFVSTPGVVAGVLSDSLQKPSISIICSIVLWPHTFFTCLIILVMIRPYRIYAKRILQRLRVRPRRIGPIFEGVRDHPTVSRIPDSDPGTNNHAQSRASVFSRFQSVSL